MSNRSDEIHGGAPTSCCSWSPYAFMISKRGGIFTALYRPPGRIWFDCLVVAGCVRANRRHLELRGLRRRGRLRHEIHTQRAADGNATRPIVRGDVRESFEISTRRILRTRFSSDPPVAAAARLSSPLLHASSSVSAAAYPAGIPAHRDRHIVAAVLALVANARRQPPDGGVIKQQRLGERLHQVDESSRDAARAQARARGSPRPGLR